jgi:DNA-binding NtrC family response regulator
MRFHAQAKILRALETKEIHRLAGRGTIPLDFRVIAATNQDPEQLVREGRFRNDLYYRLNVAHLQLPPLRDRKEDIPQLLDYYNREFSKKFGRHVAGFNQDALDLLFQYDWPGNVRELKNLVEATFINLPREKIALMDLPKTFQQRLKGMEGFSQKERDRLLSALFETRWNKSKAAQKLNWSRMTLYRKMMKYRIVQSQR